MSSDSAAPLGADTSNYRKYQTGNPVMQRVIGRFIHRICTKVDALKPSRIVDLGCGEGIVASELATLGFDFEYLGLDLNLPSVEAARQINADQPNMRFEEADIITTEPEEGWADLVICLEVLEHLPDPPKVVQQMMCWTRKNAIVSVPWEPWFKLGNLARGKHLRRLGNHPEHIQQFQPRTLRTLLSRFSRHVQIETCFPWIIGTVVKS